ncbi:IPT/TIG domain-containing protein [Legionella quinlivanii]|nr:IPT/TIG domain-containing protein [Legionella quinlivanii]
MQAPSILRKLGILISALIPSFAMAGIPLWTFKPLTPTALSLSANDTAIVQYLVTNQSSRPHTLNMVPIRGITQLTTGLGVCGSSFVLSAHASCTLSLQINGSLITQQVTNGPSVCQSGSPNQCYQPNPADTLRITIKPAATDALISVSNSPLSLLAGENGVLIIHNNSLEVSATNIVSNFSGTALEGKVIETGNTCASVLPGKNCTLTYTGLQPALPGSFSIKGSNTNTVYAAIEIKSAATISSINPNSGLTNGGTGFVLTGSGLLGVTGVSFDGVPATYVNVVNSMTVTGVTPAHAAGTVDVTALTANGTATLNNGYTFVPPAIGEATQGGIVACSGGPQLNLIAAVTDNSPGMNWGGDGIPTGATNFLNGTANTETIISVLGANGGNPYAALLCSNFEVDSQGNTPCEPGNACYNDWFLPALFQLNCLYSNQVAIGGFSAVPYWTSTEFNPAFAYRVNFANGDNLFAGKDTSGYRVRCVRNLMP